MRAVAGRGGRRIRVVAASATVALVAGLLTALSPAAPTAAASPRAATYYPTAGSEIIDRAVYPKVVADGSGTFHSVVRQDGASQWIEYRRSTDGGRTWRSGLGWTGHSGAATRPSIAVSGGTVAVTYVGGYCVPSTSSCGEAPYLVRSSDGGRSWTAPLRLAGGDTFDVAVAVDGSRVWVTWHGRNADNNDQIVVRRYAPTGSTPQLESAWPGTGTPLIAAGDGGGVVAFLARVPEASGQQGLVPRAQLLDGDGFGAAVDFPDAQRFRWVSHGVATAGGRAHILLRDGGRYLVRSAGVGDAEFGPAAFALAGSGGSIAARAGLVVVASVTTAGVTAVVRSEDGSAFDSPISLGSTVGAVRALVGIAVRGSRPMAQSSLAGAVHVVTDGTDELTVASLRDDGTALTTFGVRRMDRPETAGAFVTTGGPPAADGTSAVTGWMQLDTPLGSRWRTLLAPAWRAENASVDWAELIQGPARADTLVAGRRAKVVAQIGLAAAEPKILDVTTVVTDDQGTEVARSVQPHTVEPGSAVLGLPAGVDIIPALGRTYSVKVTVQDPPGPGAFAGDNSAETALADSAAVVQTRPLTIAGVSLDTDAGEVSCSRMFSKLVSGGRDVDALLPVAGSLTNIASCLSLQPTPSTVFPTSGLGLSQAMVELDYLARMSGVDTMVGYAPGQWLYQTVKPGTLAIGHRPGRAIVFNDATHPRVLAHEASHNLGLTHLLAPAQGWDIGLKKWRQAVDYMSPVDGDHWVSAGTWDRLARVLGGPENAPSVPDPASAGVWVRGSIVTNDDGTYSETPARWVPAGLGETAPSPAEPSPSEPHVVARQLDGNGDPLPGTQQDVPVQPIDAVYAPGTTPNAQPLGYTIAGLVTPTTGAKAIQLALVDAQGRDISVETRAVGERPTVQVDSPTAGTVVNRGETMQVAWTAVDPDSTELTADLLVSGDGGSTWKSLAYNVGTSPAMVTVPADLDGDRVRVRVVVSDGVRMATDDSDSFTVGGVRTEVRDRVVFSRGTRVADTSRRAWSLVTSNLDGTGEQQIALPVRSTYDSGKGGVWPCYANTQPCPAQYWNPSWAPDGSRIYFSSDLYLAGMGGTATGVADLVGYHLWSVNPDGTDLRRLTTPLTQAPDDDSYRGANFCPNVHGNEMAWYADGNRFVRNGIWVAGSDGSNPRQLFAQRTSTTGGRDQGTYPWPALDGTGWLTYDSGAYLGLVPSRPDTPTTGDVVGYGGVGYSSCPRFSPDGSRIAFRVSAVQADSDPGSSAVVVMDADGGNQRIVTNRGEGVIAVDWITDDSLILTSLDADATPATYSAARLDLTSLARTPMGAPWTEDSGPTSLRRLGDQYYGSSTRSTPAADNDFATVDAGGVPHVRVADTHDAGFDAIRMTVETGENVPVVTPQPVPVPVVDAGGPYAGTVGVTLTLSAGGTALEDPLATVAWDLDGDGIFGDADGRTVDVTPTVAGTVTIRARVTPGAGPQVTSPDATLSVLAASGPTFAVAPDATAPPVGRPALVRRQTTIPAGVAADVQLGAPDDPGPFMVVATGPGIADVTGDPAGLPRSTGLAGTVQVTPEADFRGLTTLTYARFDDLGTTEQVEVTVIGDEPPASGGAGPVPPATGPTDTTASPPALPSEVQAQTASPRVAKKIRPKGKTVLLRAAVVTNAAQRATARVTVRKAAKHKRFYKVITTRAGKITIRLRKPHARCTVTLTLTAPPTAGYTAYTWTKTWKVKKA